MLYSFQMYNMVIQHTNSTSLHKCSHHTVIAIIIDHISYAVLFIPVTNLYSYLST